MGSMRVKPLLLFLGAPVSYVSCNEATFVSIYYSLWIFVAMQSWSVILM